MDENKKFEMEEAVEGIQPEAEVREPEVQEELHEVMPEPETTSYRGIGAGRKESPFADSP